jgi:SAM-dependent methyltransferase
MIFSEDRSPLAAFGPHIAGEVSPALWKALHDTEHLALHAAMYTWPARQIARGRVLDLGCEAGFGGLLIAAANNALEIIGIDLDLPGLRYSQNMLGKGGISCVQADACRLPVMTESVTGIYMIHLLHLVDEPGRILSEVWRALEPGGMAIVSAPRDEGRLDDHLRSALDGQFSEVLYPTEIRGRLPSYPARSFRLDGQASGWLAVCRKD